MGDVGLLWWKERGQQGLRGLICQTMDVINDLPIYQSSLPENSFHRKLQNEWTQSERPGETLG